MPSYTTDGIILRRVDYGEADRILTVLTRERGKVGVIARGVRKPKSRLAASTDMFMCSTMQLATGRGELDVLTQAVAVAPVVTSSDPVRLACAGACAELADRLVESGHPDDVAYQLLADALRSVADESRDPRAGLVWFARRMIERLGYAPQLSRCANCDSVLPERRATFVARVGGLVCSNCTSGTGESGSAISCDVRAIKVLRILSDDDPATFWRLRLDSDLLDVLESVVEAELAERLDRRLRSFDMLRSLTPTKA